MLIIGTIGMVACSSVAVVGSAYIGMVFYKIFTNTL